MSRFRQRLTVDQEPYLAVRSFPAGYGSGFLIPPHKHEWRQLLYACSGAMTIQASRWCWMAPPGKAVFIQAGCVHSIRMWGSVALRSLVFPVSLASTALEIEECRVLSVTPLLRELILRIIEMGALDSRVEGHARLLAVLLDELSVSKATPLSLPLPVDPRAIAVANGILANPARDESLDELSREFGAARRTLERLFRRETGISFGMWRQKARMLDACRHLAEGKSVTDTALDTGYSSVSAFIAAFKQTFGCTPGRL